MSIDAYELYNSRRVNIAFDRQSADLEFFCRGTTDDVLARAAIIAITPLLFFGLTFENLEVEPLGGGCWLGHASYNSSVTPSNPGQGGSSPPPPPPPAPGTTDPLGPGFSFDITGVTEKKTQSIEVVSRTGYGVDSTGTTFPDHKGAIGVSPDGEIKGVDVITPKFEFSITRTFGFVTLGYFQTLFNTVGRTNDASFYGFDQGEILMTGASGSVKDTQTIEVTMKFGAQPNQTNIPIVAAGFSGDPFALIVPDKRGWEYMEVLYKDVSQSDFLAMVPWGVVVHKVYEEADFSQLGIGG